MGSQISKLGHMTLTMFTLGVIFSSDGKNYAYRIWDSYL